MVLSQAESENLPKDEVATLLYELRKRVAEAKVAFPFNITRQQFEYGLLWAKMQELDRNAFYAKRAGSQRWTPVPRTQVAKIISRLLGIRNWQVVDEPLKTILDNRKRIEFVQKEFSSGGVGREGYKILRHSETVKLANQKRREMAERGEWTGRPPWGAYPLKDSNVLRWRPAREKILSNFFARLAAGEYPHVAAKHLKRRGVPRNVRIWITKNQAYRAYEKGSDRGCTQYGKQIYKGLHRAVVDHETWEKGQWFQEARAATNQFGLLWARDYKLAISPELKITLQNPFPNSKDKLVVDPAEETRLEKICQLYSKVKRALEVSKAVRTKPSRVTDVVGSSDYRIIGDKWETAHRIYRLHPRSRTRRREKELRIGNVQPALSSP